MRDLERRTFLKVLGAGTTALAASSPVFSALADAPRLGGPSEEFFIFVHAAGGWDVTLWADPRNERRGLVEPPSSANSDRTALRRWVDAPLDGDVHSFVPVRPAGSNLVFGPAIGDLADFYDRITLVNGIAMNTVSHLDGTVFSATGRHLNGGHVVASSIDTLMANEFGREQLFPLVSVRYPSSYVGALDPRVVPLSVTSIGAVARSLSRTNQYDLAADRDDVTAMLSEEATDLARRAHDATPLRAFASHFQSLHQMLGGDLQNVFRADALRAQYRQFNYRGRFQSDAAVNVAFAVEAMRRNVVRCVSFALGGLDTHNANYRTHGQNQQEMFDMLAALVRTLDTTPHPTRPQARLSEHTHLLVMSDFCRTPQVNLSGGRDHYPNNSALILSPRFRGNTVVGRSDLEQLLPMTTRHFADGDRAIAPPDILATFLHALGVDPRRYLRDGDVVMEMLRT